MVVKRPLSFDPSHTGAMSLFNLALVQIMQTRHFNFLATRDDARAVEYAVSFADGIVREFNIKLGVVYDDNDHRRKRNVKAKT